jgi:hypothetical protein
MRLPHPHSPHSPRTATAPGVSGPRRGTWGARTALRTHYGKVRLHADSRCAPWKQREDPLFAKPAPRGVDKQYSHHKGPPHTLQRGVGSDLQSWKHWLTDKTEAGREETRGRLRCMQEGLLIQTSQDLSDTGESLHDSAPQCQ